MGQNAAAPGVPIGLLDVYNHHWNAGISMFIIIIIIIIILGSDNLSGTTLEIWSITTFVLSCCI